MFLFCSSYLISYYLCWHRLPAPNRYRSIMVMIVQLLQKQKPITNTYTDTHTQSFRRISFSFTNKQFIFEISHPVCVCVRSFVYTDVVSLSNRQFKWFLSFNLLDVLALNAIQAIVICSGLTVDADHLFR